MSMQSIGSSSEGFAVSLKDENGVSLQDKRFIDIFKQEQNQRKKVEAELRRLMSKKPTPYATLSGFNEKGNPIYRIGSEIYVDNRSCYARFFQGIFSCLDPIRRIEAKQIARFEEERLREEERSNRLRDLDLTPHKIRRSISSDSLTSTGSNANSSSSDMSDRGCIVDFDDLSSYQRSESTSVATPEIVKDIQRKRVFDPNSGSRI